MNKSVEMFGICINVLGRSEAVGVLLSWLFAADRKCRYVVTPNVDHVVRINKNPNFLDAYRGASLVLADGKPVVLASKILRKGLPETVPGSDLVPLLFDACPVENEKDRVAVFLLGAAEGVANRAAEAIHARWSGVRVVGTYSPPHGFECDPEECDRIIDMINESKSDLLVLGLGAPKQELWIHRHRHLLRIKVALCVGATIDFLAGEKSRAPLWIQRVGLEWLHRMLSEPRRLLPRYAYDAWVYPILFAREFRRRYL